MKALGSILNTTNKCVSMCIYTFFHIYLVFISTLARDTQRRENGSIRPIFIFMKWLQYKKTELIMNMWPSACANGGTSLQTQTLRQENEKFQASMGHIESSRLACISESSQENENIEQLKKKMEKTNPSQ